MHTVIKKDRGSFIALIACALCNSAFADDSAAKKDLLSSYVVDVSPGPVSAATIVGVGGSAITTIHTSQDFALTLSPMTSKDSKNGMGISITPSRTSIIPMSGQTYESDQLHRAIANLTFSYAQNFTDISGISYKKTGFSVDTFVYWKLADDPVDIGYQAFLNCVARKDAQDVLERATMKHRQDQVALNNLLVKLVRAEADLLAHPESKEGQETAEAKATRLAAQRERDDTKRAHDEAQVALATDTAHLQDLRAAPFTAQKKCDLAAQNKSRWNASRLMLSYGDGRIEPDAGGTQLSLGRSWIFAGLLDVGDDRGIYFTYQNTRDAVDATTIPSVPAYRSNSQIAARFVAGTTSDATTKFLIEISNAKDTSVSSGVPVYKSAVGIDKKLTDGVWLQLRYGKSTTSDAKGTQNKGLFNLAWVPTSTLNGAK